MFDSIYSKVAERVGGVTFADGDSHGYWVDDVDGKTRFIMLNICNCRYELQEDGTSLYPKMWIFQFGQEQIDMVIAALGSVPDDDWSVVVAAHSPLDKSVLDGEIMTGILKSYKCRNSYNATIVTEYGDTVSAECDFTGAAGELIGYFYGHIHKDTHNVTGGVTMVSTTCDAIEDIDPVICDSRLKGTVSEHSFDVFTVDRHKKTLYATRIGSGEDRMIKYE